MDLLMPSTGLLFWMTIVFLVVLAVLWKWGFPAITNMVRERKNYIDESLRKAHEANEKLANIQQEGESILQEAREKQAKEEGARLLSDAKSEIEAQKQQAIREIRAQVAELSVKIAEKIVRERLSSDDKQMELIDKLLDEVSATEPADNQ